MSNAFYLFEDLQELFKAKQRPKVLGVLRQNNIQYLVDARGLPMVARNLLDNYGVKAVEEEKEEFKFTPIRNV